MNTTELKALAEMATGGAWVVGSSPFDQSRHIYCQSPVTDGEDSWLPLIASTDDAETLVNFEANATYIAAANPAAILELIAAHEDAQGEIRALRATEQALRERVKALEEVAAALLPFADDASAINGYGYYRPKNPHDFHPDAESCTEDEIAAHKAACEAWDAGIYKDNYGDGWVSPNVHILRAPWGIGSYTDEVPEIASICNRARVLLEQKP